MPLHDLPITLVHRELDGGGLHLAEALNFPELLALHAQPERLRAVVRGLAKQILEDAPALDVHRRVPAGPVAVARVLVSLAPPQASAAWSEPVTLRLDVLRWRHGEEAWVAYVPAVGIQVVAAREDALDELVLKHVRAALARTKAAERLFDLVQLARVDAVTVSEGTVTPNLRTPAQVAAARGAVGESAKPVIEDAGTVLTEGNTPPAYEADGVVERLADALAGQNPRSVLLVGPSGVGKTTVFGELFRQRAARRLEGAAFWATSGARLIAGTSGYGLWQERCQRLCKEARRDGAILHLGNLFELMEVGKAGGSEMGVAAFFRPYLARGEVLAVAECTPEQLPLIERSSPHLLATFQTVHVEEPRAEAVRVILGRVATDEGTGTSEDTVNTDKHVRRTNAEAGVAKVSAESIDAIERLHRRYATYSANPGRPLRFLRNLLHDPVADAATPSPADVTRAFSRETGLPLFLLDDATPLDLAAAREHFGSRVIGQGEAVELVTDLLATVKAALNRPRRPIASLLFIGPTGVGKTEMAKALADYFFGGEGAGGRARTEASPGGEASAAASSLSPSPDAAPRLVRFDMSEFSTPAAVARLVGSAWEAEGLLTGKVREQPFCVLLLDEFEKAHPSFFDLLLQVLGEGRLTDAAGRLADFSNAVVVMTSNLGAEQFQAGPFGLSRATTSPASHAKGHFTDAVREFLRPELFNRIDRVVPFLPLDAVTIRRISERELELVRRRDGVRQRRLTLEATPAAIDHLAATGYDPLYGARPLKRRIEHDVLAPLADAINQHAAAATPLSARVDAIGSRLVVEVRAVRRREGETGGGGDGALHGSPPAAPSPHLPVASVASLRRRVQAIARSPAAMGLQNELFTLTRRTTKMQARPGAGYAEPAERERLKRLQAVANSAERLGGEVVGMEDALLLNAYEGAPLPFQAADTHARLARLTAAADELLLHLFTLDQTDPHAVTLALYGSAAADLFMLARAYREAVARDPGTAAAGAGLPEAAVLVCYYTRLGRQQIQRHTVAAEQVEAFLSTPRPVLGVALSVRAPFARARLETEAGLHVVEEERNKNPHAVLVDTSPLAVADYRPPKDVEFRVALVAGQRRRTYTLDRQEATDPVTGQTYRWPAREVWQVVVAAADGCLKRRAEAILEA
jgi:ATP-dependent Clp protease ATP-binding subunit ClpA